MKKPARILVVEDEAHLAEGLLYNLQAEGYEVDLAYEGEGALALLLPPGGTAPVTAASGMQGAPGSKRDGASLLGLGAGNGRDSEPSSAENSGRASETGGQVVANSAAPTLAAGEPLYDAVLLDVMLPGKSGFEVVSALRAASNYVPVLMLTARSRPEDVLYGLEAGADDYLAKPFDLSILLARLHVLLRRMRWQRPQNVERAGNGSGAERLESEQEQPTSYSFAGRTIDFSMLELHAKGVVIRLTLMEADFLRYLSRNPLRIIPRKELLEQVWRVREDTDTRAIDNFVVRLRRYLEDEPANPVYLKTVRGVGYRFLPNGE